MTVAPSTLVLAASTHAQGTIQLPGSKSISNRTLLLAALAPGSTTLRGLLDADDVQRMREALIALGVRIEPLDGGMVRVHGCQGIFPVPRAELFLGNAGTAFRPLTAVLAVAGNDLDRAARRYVLRGVPRMHERPIGDLVDALRQLGADVQYLGEQGFPPLAIMPASGSSHAGRVSVRGNVSSQFVSALLMALPMAAARAGHDIAVEVIGELISKPYVAITTNLMRRFGVTVESTPSGFLMRRDVRYRSPGTVHVEGDASGASYFLAAGAIAGGPVRVLGVDRASIQGDVAFADVLGRMGADIRSGEGWLEARGGHALQGVDVDCVAIPDAAMTLASVALFASGATTLRNIGSWRVKETDRISAMATELGKLGANVETGPDWLRVTPPARLQGAAIDTYDDHRMAMCFALASLGGVQVHINDPQCVAKTYPGFFDDFRTIVS